MTPAQFRGLIRDAGRYWEPRRLIYNGVLLAVVVLWVVITWPHLRPAMTWTALGGLCVLALIANACFSAAYLVEMVFRNAGIRRVWKRWRWALWMAGTILAACMVWYWIADEVYPFV
ncbi:MAG: hypothetical protein PF446_12805 [Oleiagrimonas sp.]|jgi:hypothetical protein|nr:hypothetical protein [Oleiagrimonas sp.]